MITHLPELVLHQSPRTFGKVTSRWTPELAAEGCFEQRLTVNQVSAETIRGADPPAWGWVATSETLDHQPRSGGCQEKTRRDALITLAQRCGWEVGYLDEVWWSRVSQPNIHSWSEPKEPLREPRAFGGQERF